MEEKLEALKDLKDIKGMMEQSSKFISLSGLSGVLSGLYALVGGFFILGKIQLALESPSKDFLWIYLASYGLGILGLALISGVILTVMKVRKEGQRILTSTSIRLAVNLFLPLVAGGVFILALFYNRVNLGMVENVVAGNYLLYAPVTLIFYGLALINASKYALHDIRTLGAIEVLLGLISLFVPDLEIQLYIWMFGFGIMHILYGSIMYFKYERK